MKRVRAILRIAAAQYSAVVALVAMIAIFSILMPDIFPSAANFRTILTSQVVLLILTLGLTASLTVGEFDLSISAVVGFASVLIAWMNVTTGWPIELAVAAALVSGLLMGVLNSVLIVLVGIPAFVATLGTGTVLVGLTFGMSGSVVVGGIDQGLVGVFRYTIWGLPVGVYLGFLLATVFWYVYEHTPLGRHLIFVGQGREVAQLSGIRVQRLRVSALITTSTIAALAGVVLTGTLGSADPRISQVFLLPAYAGAFLGATVIKPGRFNAWGTVIALYLLVTGITGLNLLGVSGWVEQVFYGGALIVSVSIARITIGARVQGDI